MDLLSYFLEEYPALAYITGGLAIAIGAYAGYVKLTPNKEDDKKWAKIKASRVWGPLIRLVSRTSAAKKPEEK